MVQRINSDLYGIDIEDRLYSVKHVAGQCWEVYDVRFGDQPMDRIYQQRGLWTNSRIRPTADLVAVVKQIVAARA